MTDSMTETAETAAAESHDDEHHDHPSDLFYVKIAAVLAVFTAIEVGTFFVEETAPAWSLYLVLTLLMIIKFAMVGAYFMHLKYDTKWFRQVFISGIVLAIGVYFIFFLAFDLFGWGTAVADFFGL